ncbi:hypothetical protein ABK040_011495 [Willaertia magna]
MNEKYFNRTLIAIGEHVFEHSQSDVKEITIKVEDKKTKEEIKMFKPQWSIAIECILDHCRTIYDILPEEAGICVALQHDLNNCSMMNQWNWEQQNFLQISNNLSIEIEKHFGKLSENKKMTSDMMKTEDFERFSKLLLNQLFSQSEIQANEKNQTNIKNAFRVLYVTKCCFDLNEYENLRKNVIIPLVESFTKVFENLKMEIKLNKINNNVEINNILLNLDEEELNNITCTLDIIIPTVPDILQNHLNINNNHNNTNNNIEVGYKSQTFEISTGQLRESTIFDRIKIWSIEKDILGKVIRERIAQRQYGFILIAVQGIPMRDSEETNNYDVLLACKGLPIELTQDVTLYGSSICLRWVRADPKRSIEHLYTTKSVHRITPVFPYTLPTLCLMKHLMTKKPVALIFESRYNLHHKHSPTHLILQHGQDVYLHVLHLNKVFQPYSVSLSDETTNVKYKINEFMDIVNKHLLRINVKKNTTLAIEDVTNGNTTTTNNNNTGTNNSSVVNVKQQENQMYSLMKHNHFIYRVPSSIERYTRVFSLTVDESSILFNESAKENYPTLFNQILNPLLRIILNRSQEQLTEQEQLDIDKLFTALYQCAKNNDEHIFPELRNDHTKRWNTYRKLWSELRSFVTSMSYKEFGLNIMERLWPQFYYDKNQNETDSSTKRSKRTIEVQRDRYGNIVFPIQLGALTVLALGKVVFDRPAFHTEKYIWPVGYKSTRYYTSVKDTNKRCLYTCEIKDGGDAPIFVLISEDNPNEVIEAPSATAAWTVIVKQINKIKSEESGKRVFTNVSGPEYYGLAHPTVMKLISQLPNAEKVHRPNAPHQPIKPEVSPNTNVTTNTATGVTEINDNSEDENTAFTSSTTNPSTTITTQTTNPTNENVEVSSDIQIKQKRLKRDESVYYERDLVRNDIQKVQWRPNNSLLNFYQERFDKLSPKSLDGESEGQKALYSYLNLNQQEHFSRGGSGSAGDTNTSNANQQGHGNMSYGGNRHRKFGHQQKRKFMYH